MPKIRNDVPRPGPKVWWELNDKAEEKVKGVIDRHKTRGNWMYEFVENAKVILGKKDAKEPEVVAKVSSSSATKVAKGPSASGGSTVKEISTKPVSVKKTKRARTRKSSPGNTEVVVPPSQKDRQNQDDHGENLIVSSSSTKLGKAGTDVHADAALVMYSDNGEREDPCAVILNEEVDVSTSEVSNVVIPINSEDIPINYDECLRANDVVHIYGQTIISEVEDTNECPRANDVVPIHRKTSLSEVEDTECPDAVLEGEVRVTKNRIICDEDEGRGVEVATNFGVERGEGLYGICGEIVEEIVGSSSRDVSMGALRFMPSVITSSDVIENFEKTVDFNAEAAISMEGLDEVNISPEPMKYGGSTICDGSNDRSNNEVVQVNVASDADSESDVVKPGIKQKVRKSRVSLRHKRALVVSEGSDSDGPATKNRKIDQPNARHFSSKNVCGSIVLSSNQCSDVVEPLRRSTRNANIADTLVCPKPLSAESNEESDNSEPVPVVARVSSSRGIRKSSVRASLLKVSAARGVSVTDLIAEQDVVLVKPIVANTMSPSEVAEKIATPVGNARAPVGRVVRPARKVFQSGGVSPAVGTRTAEIGSASQGLGSSKTRSRLQNNRPGFKTPVQNNPIGRTHSNLVGKGVPPFMKKTIVTPSKSIQEKEMEARNKEERESAAMKRKEYLLKQKAEDQKLKREARILRVKEARQNKELNKARNVEKENAEKLEVLKIRETKAKLQAKKNKPKQLGASKDDLMKTNKMQEEKRKHEALKESLRDKQAALAVSSDSAYHNEDNERNAHVEDASDNQTVQVVPPANEALNSTYTKSPVNSAAQGPSSYDMTPARHELPPEPSKDENNYGLDDLRSDEDTDDEDCPRKEVPSWAEGTLLRTALLKQCYMGPDVDLIFADVGMPELSSMFSHQRKRFFKRTSSAVWDAPPTSFKHN